ncbi:CCA tRNA nucleotidyltransferase [Sporolactobacillus putidus]|uniref:CCA-adding enzyme n=1 Tax=Sporolactobacillus putidus TaxID=492735 RepID=A0A917VZF0_9BACL|nr:CCA tRNA nucleotidyltransferase [Sporolactobacillus putidus]GGL47968.1 CCA-adding enzyme [Sporolactobacillus putidus]
MSFPFAKAAGILDTLTAHGFEAYVVGGAVRDYLLDRPVHDIDIATSAHPADVVALFKRTIPVGIEHGTVVVLSSGTNFEVTTYRSESGYDDYRHPNQVVFETTLEKDLMRRDFTINALAMDRSGRVIDLFGGRDDLARGLIRTVGRPEERISEDPLRMMRGIRFTSELSFTLGQAELAAFKDRSLLLKKISVERIDQEMTKLLAGRSVNKAIGLLFETKCFDALPFPEQAADRRALERVRFSILKTDAERWTAFLTALRIFDLHAFARVWNWSRSREKTVSALQKYDAVRKRDGWNPVRVYYAGTELAKSVERLQVAFGRADTASLAGMERDIDSLWKTCRIHQRGELAVTGNDLLKWSSEHPGPWLSEALAMLEKQVITGSVANEMEEIESWFKAWQKQRKPS